jgi:hypothetical protein
MRDLQAFDPHKVHKGFGEPEVFALQAAVNKALVPAFDFTRKNGIFFYLRRASRYGQVFH